ncbi:MAG TPA: hypothetical protein VKV06_07245 [Acidimicrobiales bacterium]|nr:hypothetical protein [Acidimicrobiales bacterium]
MALAVAALIVVLVVQTGGKGGSSVGTRRGAPGPTVAPTTAAPTPTSPPATVRPATLREVRIGGQRRCIVVSDQVMAQAQRSPIPQVRAGAEAAAAVWLPAAPGRSGCRSTVTSAGSAGAAAVLSLVRRSGPLDQVTSCLSGSTGGGMVDLVLRYPGQKRPAVIRAVLGPCGFFVSPNGHRRALPPSTPAALVPLHPPAWADGPGSSPTAPGRQGRLPERATGR